MFYKIGALKSFAKFIKNLMRWSLFLTITSDSSADFFQRVLQNFKNSFFTEQLRTLSTNTLPTYVTLTFEKVKNESLEECSILRVKKKKP